MDLAEGEAETLTAELEVMLRFAATLEEVELGATPEWTPPAPDGRRLRADSRTPSLPREAALALAPTREGGYFKVPRTLDEG